VQYQDVQLIEFVVMPNHVHGIIALVGAQFIAPDHENKTMAAGAINRAPTIGAVVRFFKARSTRFIRKTIFPTFAWQRNYYERVIRNDDELNQTRQYILDNPAQWDADPENIDSHVRAGFPRPWDVVEPRNRAREPRPYNERNIT
jgi:REP element-mobilizing transposase RayT